MKNFILGSAQFGMEYGISNLDKKVKPSEIKSILNLAKKNNIYMIDTAISYNKSEQILGEIGVKNFKIISKLPKLPTEISDINLWIKEQAKSSINKLNVKSLYGLLLHHPSDLIGYNGKMLVKALYDLKSSGLVYKIGVSIYDPKELDSIFTSMKIEIVQAPLNLLDRRIEYSGWLSKLYNKNIEFHARSVFLQGLLLMQRNQIPLKFEKWSSIWDKWRSKIDQSGFNAIELCLNYPLSLKEVNSIIIGVNNTKQLNEIILASKKKTKKQDLSFMISDNQMLINPSKWSQL